MPMSPRQRVEAALRHAEPDRTPAFEYVLRSPVADRLLGRPYAAEPEHWDALVADRGWEAAVRQNAIDRLDLAALLAHDLMYVWPNPPPGRSDARHAMPPAVPTDDPVGNVRRHNERADAAVPGPADDCL
ncbi:hypothetical protein HQ576_01170, partial [bacterium]|nr:hypothetical protein [bacterium]